MDKLTSAIRRYDLLAANPSQSGALASTRELGIWLADDVLPVVEDFSARPTFREYASWPVRTLCPGADTPERKRIDAIDATLSDYARGLKRLAGQSLVARHLRALNPPPKKIVRETVTVGSTGSRRIEAKTADVDMLVFELGYLACLAKRSESEPVNVDDYFEPQPEFVLDGQGGLLQRGELIVSLNPELHPLGNFIVRCLFRRLETRLTFLDALHRKIVAAVRKSGRTYEKLVATAADERKELRRQWQELRESLTAGRENSVRDSCAILLQVYAALHPKPNVGWLGVSLHTVDAASKSLRLRLRHPTHPGLVAASAHRPVDVFSLHPDAANMDMIERVAAALSDLRHIYDRSPIGQAAVEEAIAGGGLVIVQDGAQVYWEQAQIPGKWNGKRWEFFLELARKSSRGADLEESDLYPSECSESNMGMAAERLKKLLPPALRKLIVSGRTPRSYRLKLEPHRLHVF